MKSKKILVEGIEIITFAKNNSDYISLTDIARFKNNERTEYVVQNWMRNRETIEFLGIWEMLNNPLFKHIEFDVFRLQSGLNSFSLTPKRWIESVNSIGLINKSGRYGGGTYAHSDIAFEFAAWISAEFKLYMIKEFQRLKNEEQKRIESGWNAKRTLTKINYRIHTDAINKYLVPESLSKNKINIIYTSEADVLNVAIFGMTAKEWRDANPKLIGNIRDYVDVIQLVILANLESINAELIRQGLSQSDRLIKLNQIAIIQMKSLLNNSSIKKLQ